MTMKQRQASWAAGAALATQLATGLGGAPMPVASDRTDHRIEQSYDGRRLERELYKTSISKPREHPNGGEADDVRARRGYSDLLLETGKAYASHWLDGLMDKFPKPLRNYSQRKLNQLQRYGEWLSTGKNPLVYVVVPAHREAGTIEKTVASILNQRYDNIIIDIEINGETGKEADATEKGLGKYITDDRVHIHKSNPAGIAPARNTGTQRAVEGGAKVIVFADADVVLENDAVSYAVASYYAGNDGGQGSVPYNTSYPLIQGMASVSAIGRLGMSALSELSDDVSVFAAGGGMMWLSDRGAKKVIETYGYVFPEGRLAEDTAGLRLLNKRVPTGDDYRPWATQSDRRVVQEGLFRHWWNSVRYSLGDGRGDDFPAYRTPVPAH